MTMTTYCVWMDNLFEELFAIEKVELEKNVKLQEVLKKEKNTIHYVEADSLTGAFAKYKEIKEKMPVRNAMLH